MGSLAATPTPETAGSCPCAPGASPGEGHGQGSSLRVSGHPIQQGDTSAFSSFSPNTTCPTGDVRS